MASKRNKQDLRTYAARVVASYPKVRPKVLAILRQADNGTMNLTQAFFELGKLDEKRLGWALSKRPRRTKRGGKEKRASRATTNDQSNQPQPDTASREHAQELIEAGRFAEAAKAYEKLVELSPDDANLWRDLGMLYSATEQHEKSISAFNKAVSLRPDFGQAWDMLGMQFWEAEQFALAAVAFEKAIEADPNNKHSLATLAQMYALLKRPDDAWDIWCKLRDLDPKYAKEIEFVVREFLEY